MLMLVLLLTDEHSRVKLSASSNVSNSDYINASTIVSIYHYISITAMVGITELGNTTCLKWR